MSSIEANSSIKFMGSFQGQNRNPRSLKESKEENLGKKNDQRES